MIDLYQFQCDSTDEGKDISEGEMAYRIEERGGWFLLVEYLPDEPFAGEVLERSRTRDVIVQHLRKYLKVRA